MKTNLAHPIVTYLKGRSTLFILESQILYRLSKPILKEPSSLYEINAQSYQTLKDSLLELFEQDAKNIDDHLYPIQVLIPESPLRHIRRMPKILADGLQIARRRNRGKTTEFDSHAQAWLSTLPRYYKRNFHFQSNGYLSRHSAELYEHQVETLFSGSADPMRRMIVAALKKKFRTYNGEGLKFLELGAGTGGTTRFVQLAFPKAKIVAIDLSQPYLDHAQKRFKNASKVDWIQGDAAQLPFQNDSFDAVFSVFLFHELPLAVRAQVISESFRVAKANGMIGWVDSLQMGDRPELDSLLIEFPKTFHEPFFNNYLKNPMEKLLHPFKTGPIQREFGFVSQLIWSHKSETGQVRHAQ